MPRAFSWILVAAASVAAAAAVRAQAPAPPAAQTPGSGFTTSTTAVVVDVVVRDAKGAPIVDLKPSDFELLEDGAKQRIASVELIAPGSAATPAPAAATGAKTPRAAESPTAGATTPSADRAAAPAVIALVFHRLSAEGRDLAAAAARSYLDRATANDFAGVFSIDTSLQTLQTFTTDRARLTMAVERAATTQAAIHQRSPPMSSAYGDADGEVSPTASADSPGRPVVPSSQVASANTAGGIDARFAKIYSNMERSFGELIRDRNGHLESAALTSLVTGLGTLPGRKTIVLFSEGMTIPPAAEAKFRAVVDSANRANVSIYAIDAKGLKVHSGQLATARSIGSVRISGEQAGLPEEREDLHGSMTRELEQNEFLIRKDPAASLGWLSKQTGGFLIDNTNDLVSAFQRIDADRRFHYLLTYTSTNTAMDGAFRRIAVTVKRRNADVRARSGYVAVPALGTVPVLRFESNALAALAATPRPTQIPLRAASFLFPEADGSTRVALYVKAPGSGVAYFVDDNQTAWQTHFTILARIVDDKGETVRKGSQPYRMTGPAKDVHMARQGDVLFYRQPMLDPGRYTIDYALYDELSGQAGTGAQPLAVPAREPSALAVSDLILVDHAEAVPEDQKDPRNPLYLGSTLIYPNLGTPVRRSQRGSLVFFYTARAGKRPLTGRVELAEGGHVLATRSLAVPPADDTGLVQHANELPLDEIGAGSYELRVSVSDGKDTVSRTTSFVLAP
ncbi:MAG: VWA domain-containing protein [Vicinamibacteraceae bacterium]